MILSIAKLKQGLLFVGLLGVSAIQAQPFSCDDFFSFSPPSIQSGEIKLREKWFQSSLHRGVSNAIKLQVNWTRFKRYGLKEGEKVFWLQQSYLKELNEKLWDLGGTEYYLGSLDAALSDHLAQNPNVGRIIHRNYKDRVIVSTLRKEEFERLVLEPVRQKLLEKIIDLRGHFFFGNDPRFTWKNFIDHSLKSGEGKNLEEAYLDLKLSPTDTTFAKWKKSALEQRSELKAETEFLKISWEEVLAKAQSLKVQSDEFRGWLHEHSFKNDFHHRLQNYMNELRVADFLPTQDMLQSKDLRIVRRMLQDPNPETLSRAAQLGITQKLTHGAWDYSRALFLDQASHSRNILATDIKGLGARALVARDHWLAEGANIETLSHVYDQTTEELRQFYDTFSIELTKILELANSPVAYISGDDGLWALPDLSSEQHQKLLELIKRTPRLYAHIESIQVPGDFESLGNAIFKSRESLFNQKPSKK